MSSTVNSYYKQLSKGLEGQFNDLVLSPLRPAVFTEDEVARAASLQVVPRVVSASQLISRTPLSQNNQTDEGLLSILGKRPWPLLGTFEEKAIDGISSDEEEEQYPAPPKKRARHSTAPTVTNDKIKTRSHQQEFLASLQATPAALKKNSETEGLFDDNGRLAWLQREKYIKTDSIKEFSVACACCSEEQMTKPKAKKKEGTRGSGKRTAPYTPTAWLAHRKKCPFIYQHWIGEMGLTDESWSFRG